MRLPLGFALLVVAASNAVAAEYFLAPTGDDAAAGNAATPWRTLAAANARLAPGDSLVLRAGDYPGTIEPAHSGTAEAPITYRAETRGTANVQGTPGRACVWLEDRTYVAIGGINLCAAGTDLMRLDRARFCSVRHARLEGGLSWSSILCTDSHYNRFEDLAVGRSMITTESGFIVGDGWANRGSTHNVFARIHFYQVGHCPLNFWHDAAYNVVRDCVFDNQWGRNFELFSTPHLLMERCVITNGFDGSGSADGRAKLFIIESIFRRNVVLRNHYDALAVNLYRYADEPPFRMAHARIYQNTWYHNFGSALELLTEQSYRDRPPAEGAVDNIVQNNLFVANGPGGAGVTLKLEDGIMPGLRFVANDIHGDAPDARTIVITALKGQPDARRYLTTQEANTTRPKQFRANRDENPRFRNPIADDLRLAPDSPAIDTGAPLAQTTAAGGGTVLPVDDARWFFDGFGIPGESGDLIVVGPDHQSARILQTDVARGRLVLDRPLSWRNGDAVTLPFAGRGPDLGAYESGDAPDLPTGPVIPSGLRLPTMATGKDVLVATDFEAATREQWFYTWNYTRQPQSFVQIDSTTAAEGQASLRVFATGDRSVLACDIRPREWAIDRYPFVHLAYRIPPGTPVGIVLTAYENADIRGGAVVLGGTAARAVSWMPDLGRYRLIADDRWHTVELDVRAIRDRFPSVVYLKSFGFRTAGNGQKGQAFWFDDFRIQPAR